MSDKKGYSQHGLFGDINHYDSNGNKIGESHPGLFGGYTNYDANGHKTGHSDPGLFGGYNHYDNNGNKTGSSSPGLFGGYNHYDANNNSTGSSSPRLFGGYNHSSSEGCYIATSVYGSYDCPQVWVLRRYRDYKLATRWYGKLFIKVYYAMSPVLVKIFGHTKWFRKFWVKRLNAWVKKLQAKGYEDTPYRDKSKEELQ